MPTIFNPRWQKELTMVSSVRVIIVCSDHRLLWRDSFKGVDHALTSDESVPHKIIIIIYCFVLNVFEPDYNVQIKPLFSNLLLA